MSRPRSSRAWGTASSTPDGEIDRGALGTVVFNDREALVWLEELLHPLVSAEYLEWREQLAGCEHAPPVCVTEVPLLYESGGEARFDKVVVITAPTKLRRARSTVATESREARLLPDAEKVKRADYSFKNTGSLEELDAFVASVLHDLDGVRRLGWLLVVVVVLAGAAGLRPPHEPAVVRADPLSASLLGVRPRPRPRARPRPGARRRRDLPGVEVPAGGEVVVRRDRPDAADARRRRRGSRSARAATRSGPSDLYDPEINIRYGAWYLANLFQKYDTERLVLAAYNAGQGNVDRWRSEGEGIQFPETRAYVERVEKLKRIYAKAWHSQLYQ